MSDLDRELSKLAARMADVLLRMSYGGLTIDLREDLGSLAEAVQDATTALDEDEDAPVRYGGWASPAVEVPDDISSLDP